MKIVNNKITIGRGETPTYDVAVIDRDTGAPFMLPILPDNPDRKWIIEFIVRPSIYNRDDEYVFKALLLRTDKQFTTNVIETYEYASEEQNIWDDNYDFKIDGEGIEQQNRNALFRKETAKGSGVWDYAYYEAGTWVPYEFKINFMFPYEYTSKMESKTYKYEIVLFGGTSDNPIEDLVYDAELPLNIEYKKFLLNSTDFEVGGSLSE